MPPRRPTLKEVTIRARDRADAGKSTGPRDEADVEDRTRRAAPVVETLAPEDAFEAPLVRHVAAAVQRLEEADHPESRAFASAVPRREPTGAVVTRRRPVPSRFAAIDRATARRDLVTADRVRVVYRREPGRDAVAVREMPNEA